MADIDTSRAPRGVLAAQRLVTAVAEHGDLAERHYLELKSTLDLSTKKDKEKIAKFILGAANRMPETAASAFEGYAAMVIGVSEGSIAGIPPVEMMEIARIVQQYVGAAGPRWDIVWVPIEGSTNQVLVVLVDPPTAGTGPFPCRSSGDSLTNGRIYIRADGETREANADEVDLLVQRASAASKVEVDFAVELLGEISPISHDDERTILEYLSRQTARLLGALPTPDPPAAVDNDYSFSSSRAALSGFNGMSSIASAMMIPEERTEESYRASIEAWEDRFRAAWSAARSRLAASLLAPIIVKVTNRTTVFFHDVQMKLHLEGEVFAADFVDPEWADDFSDLESLTLRAFGDRLSARLTFRTTRTWPTCTPQRPVSMSRRQSASGTADRSTSTSTSASFDRWVPTSLKTKSSCSSSRTPRSRLSAVPGS